MYCIIQPPSNKKLTIYEDRNGNQQKGTATIDKTYTLVNVVRCNGTFATLMFNNEPAYVKHQYLEGIPATDGDGLYANNEAVCNGTQVRIRKGAGTSAETTGRYLNTGDSVTVTGKTLTGGYYWYEIDNSGWVRGDYLTPKMGGLTGTGSTPEPGGGTLTYGRIVTQSTTGNVQIRNGPGTSYDAIGRLFNGNSVRYYAGKTYSGNGMNWYRIEFDGNAYISADYIEPDSRDNSTVGTYSYRVEDAIAYARAHTNNSGGMSACPERNTSFSFIEGNDCANFVNQCLCAGGLPMFEGWSHGLTGIPSAWDGSGSNNKWTVTNGSRCALIAKGRLTQIEPEKVKKGDIIYNYDKDLSTHERYTHVMIATSDFDAQSRSCTVCGHTAQQKDANKELTATTCRCYHVVGDGVIHACEKRVSLPQTGNGGYAIS